MRSRSGRTLFIDGERFLRSAHARRGIVCASCHDAITLIEENKRVPHHTGIEPKCSECHQTVSQQYSKSLHAQISKKICYSCHNPHYALLLSQLTAADRKGMCMKCHDVTYTHRWLPQKDLHFKYLECASCHDLNAEIGLVFSLVERNKPPEKRILGFDALVPFIPDGKAGLLQTLDQDGNGSLSPAEIGSFIRKLREKGIGDASLELRILVLRPAHNFTHRGEQTRDCSLCHSENAKFYSKLILEIPEKEGDVRTIPVEKQILAAQDYRPLIGDFYLLGESKIRKSDVEDLLAMVRQIGFKWIDVLGVMTVAFCAALVSLHAILMFLTRKLRRSRQPEGTYPYAVAERVWHYVHGFFVILLVLSGIHLRLPDLMPIFTTFLNAVNLHNISGLVVFVDYVLWISYHLWRGQLKSRFFISPGDFMKHSLQVLRYYGYSVFIGESYPPAFGSTLSLGPLEKGVFVVVMFFLIPAQILTGILMYDVNRMLPIMEKLGGLRVVDAMHLIFAYLLASFMIIHTYFHTLRKYQ